MVRTHQRKETDDVSGVAVPAEEPSPITALLPTVIDSVPPPPPLVADLAAACVRFVATRYGVTLDFTPDTLSFVDQWLRDARVEMQSRPEAAEIVQAAAGAYLGEVIRLAFGGEWIVSDDHSRWRLCLSRVYCAFNPIGMTREALLLTPTQAWNSHFELDPGERDVAAERLASLPAVEDEEYYAPSTRFDVVSILVDALGAGMRSRGLGDIRFTRDDYL